MAHQNKNLFDAFIFPGRRELRLKEAAKLGFKRAIIPKGQVLPEVGLEVVPVARVLDAIIAALPGGMRQDFGDDDDDEMDEN